MAFPYSARDYPPGMRLDWHRVIQTFNSGPSNPLAMKAEKQPELVWQCLNCHRTFKGADAEQKALDCCGSIVQGWWANYNKWGKQKWYGR